MSTRVRVGFVPKPAHVWIHHRNTSGEKMRRNTSIAILGLVLLFGSTVNTPAQVKRVQMHIAGYLCGN